MAQPRKHVAVVEDRETRVQKLLTAMRPQVEAVMRRMAERLVDHPEAEELGAIEYELRDAGQEVARTMQQTGLTSRKKRGMSGAASPAESGPKLWDAYWEQPRVTAA